MKSLYACPCLSGYCRRDAAAIDALHVLMCAHPLCLFGLTLQDIEVATAYVAALIQLMGMDTEDLIRLHGRLYQSARIAAASGQLNGNCTNDLDGGNGHAGPHAPGARLQPSMDQRTVLRVLCHRADHAASKYLKDKVGVGKARDETLAELAARLTRLNR
jgi:hypothetical protein